MTCCPVCGHEINTARYPRIAGESSLMVCRSCGSGFLWPEPSRGDGVYEDSAYQAWGRDGLSEEELSLMKKGTFARVLDAAGPAAPGDALLDIGCAMGHLLEAAAARGYSPYGIDVSAYSTGIARRKIGSERVWTGDFPHTVPGRGDFSVITAVDVIEHLYESGLFLSRCRELLRPGGTLIMVTPDIDSLTRKVMGRRWPHFHREHAVYFSQKAMGQALASHGFGTVTCVCFRKLLNFNYVRSSLRFYGKRSLLAAADTAGLFLPRSLKKHNFSLSNGEMLVVAR